MTKPLEKAIKPVPEDNQSPKGPGSTPKVPIDTMSGNLRKHGFRTAAPRLSE